MNSYILNSLFAAKFITTFYQYIYIYIDKSNKNVQRLESE